MADEYLSLQGVVRLDSQDLGNVSAFTIKNSKFVFKLENFSEQVLRYLFGDTGWTNPVEVSVSNLSNVTRTLVFEGINTACDNRRMLFKSKIRFSGFSNLNLIDDGLTALTLYGELQSPLQITYLPKDKLTVPSLSKEFTLPKRKDLVKINKDLFLVESKGLLINRSHVASMEIMHTGSAEYVEIKLIDGRLVNVMESLSQVTKFFQNYDNAEKHKFDGIENKLAKLIKLQEDEKLSYYLGER